MVYNIPLLMIVQNICDSSIQSAKLINRNQNKILFIDADLRKK